MAGVAERIPPVVTSGSATAVPGAVVDGHAAVLIVAGEDAAGALGLPGG
jgi:hypothetical protein